jgi:hypothetical protein
VTPVKLLLLPVADGWYWTWCEANTKPEMVHVSHCQYGGRVYSYSIIHGTAPLDDYLMGHGRVWQPVEPPSNNVVKLNTNVEPSE